MPLNFSDTLMQASQNGLERIKNSAASLEYYINNCSAETKADDEENSKALQGFLTQFETAMDDDFNTADAITAIYELVKFINVKVKEEFSKNRLLRPKNSLTSFAPFSEYSSRRMKRPRIPRRKRSRLLSLSAPRRRRQRISPPPTPSGTSSRPWELLSRTLVRAFSGSEDNYDGKLLYGSA